MGTVQNSRSLVREPGMVRWAGGSGLFAGDVEMAGEPPDAPASFVRTWLLTGSLGTGDARVEEVR